MKFLIAFLKKEILEQMRTGKVPVLGMLFFLFGVMNPAVAKLTPWLLEVMADLLEQSGMTITGVTVSAMDSWVQFFKNIPMALIAFLLMQSSILTGEYQSGTLVLSLTKGLKRHQVLLAKGSVLCAVWTAGYWLCFAVTYGYNAYFWDNSVAQNLPLAVGCWWAFGLWVVALMLLFSALTRTNTGVLLGTGSTVLAVYLLSLLPKVKQFMPTVLSDGNSLIYGAAQPHDYAWAMAVAVAAALLCFAAAIALFNKKQL